MIQTCKHYTIEELVDPDTYKLYGETAWMFFPPESLQMIDDFWEFCDYYITPGSTRISINTWKWHGDKKWSGLRTIFCTEGTDRSFHRLASGFDLKIKPFKSLSDYDTIRNTIIQNKDHPLLKLINCIELGTPTWLHIDRRNISNRIRLVKG